MPAATELTPEGTRVWKFTCACGAPGLVGVDVNLREALRTGDVTRAGTWFCGWVNGTPQCVGKGRAGVAVA